MRRRTRRSASTIGGGAPHMTVGRAEVDQAGVFGPETSFTLVRIHRLHIALGRKARLAEQNALANKGSVNDEERIY
ncbi:MAG TPA: hypothetical protein VGX93_04180, partial [Chthoniobacterales bacterium]|nr:hypothetical protein [Chthoniobacterales bacterium]